MRVREIRAGSAGASNSAALLTKQRNQSQAKKQKTNPETKTKTREQRKRQLTIEKTGVVAQLKQMSAKRTRLEATLAAAQVEQY